MSRMLYCSIAAAVVLSVGAARAAEVEAVLPKETQQVMYVNFRQALDSDIVKKYAKSQIDQAMKSEEVKKTIEALGLDPLKDIDNLSVGFWNDKEKSEMNGVAILRGKFDAKKLFAAVKVEAEKSDAKVSIEDIKEDGLEIKVVKMTNENSNEKPFFATVADEKTIIGGSDKKYLVGAMKAFNGKEKSKLDKKLSDLVLKQDAKATMYFCGVVEGQLNEIPDLSQLSNLGINGEELAKQIKEMSTISVTVRLEKEVSLEMVFGMKDADSADGLSGNLDKLIDAAKTFLPLVVQSQPNLAKAKPILDDLTSSLKAKSKDKDVTFGFKIKAESIAEAAGGSDDKDDKDK